MAAPLCQEIHSHSNIQVRPVLANVSSGVGMVNLGVLLPPTGLECVQQDQCSPVF